MTKMKTNGTDGIGMSRLPSVNSLADTHSFLQQHFFAKECTNYKPRKRQHISSDNIEKYCSCGGSSDEHDAKLQISNESMWSENDITKIPTNAFGKIKFIGTDNYQKPAKYIRLADDSDIKDVMDLVVHYWSLTSSKPELIISVMGSGKSFNVTSSLKKKIFNRGLIPAIEATRGWITTFGSNIGVATAVGDAVREGQYFWEENGQVRRSIQCIGIVPWGSIRDRELLIHAPQKLESKEINDVDYSADSVVRRGKPTSLNPYHTHYLLVDDGHRNKERGVSSFRASLEQKFSKSEGDGGLDIPVVCVLIEGGANSIDYLTHSLNSDLPVLICDGSGRAADVVAYAYRSYKLCRVDPSGKPIIEDLKDLSNKLRTKLKKTFFADENNSSIRNKVKVLIDKLMKICEKKDLIYVFDVNRKENLDTAILLCLMECRRLNSWNQLNLALQWNRADVAKAKIFSSDIHWKDEELHGHFTEALIGMKLDFIKLFVDHGFSVKRYLTVSQLRKIYTRSVTDSTFLWHLLKYDNDNTRQEEVYLVEIATLMQRLTRRFAHPKYSDKKLSDHTFDKPFQELFLWAILLNRLQLAKYFWEQCVDPLSVILGGTFVCLCLAQKAKSFSTELEQQFMTAKDALEVDAKGLIDQAFENNREKALALISVRNESWGNLDCMELAALANDKDFLASSCCQTTICRTWKYGYEATGTKIVICTFTMLPILYCVQFTDEIAHYHEPTYGNNSVMDALNGTNNCSRPVPYRTQSSSPPSPTAHKLSANYRPQTKYNSPNVSVDSSASRKKKLQWYQKIYKFYTSPVVKFTNHVFWYFVFLVLHCFVLLFSFHWPAMSVPEMVLYIWTFTYFCELIRPIISYSAITLLNTFKDWWYFSSFAIWNLLEMLCSFVSLLVFSFRFFASTFAFARLLLALNFILYMFRIYKIFMVNSYLGPKVVMIKRMSRHLVMFLLLVGVLMLSYSVASQALLHPHRSYYSGIFFDIFIHGIWELFGELNDEVTQGNVPECQSPINETLFGLSSECSLRVWPTAILLTVYLIFGNILFVNMLIAIFASVFDDVQSHSEQIWKSLMYFLVSEYDKKPMLPPPFVVLEHVFIAFRWCYRRGRKKDYTQVPFSKPSPDSFRFLNDFELVCRSDYLEKQKQADQSQMELLLIQLNENFQKISHLLPELTTRTVQLSMPRRMVRDMNSSRPIDSIYNVPAQLEDEEIGAQDQSVEDILFH